MIILCKRCKLPFDNGDNIHRRVCSRPHKQKPYDYKENKKFWFYLAKTRQRFQDPVYQYLKLISSEWIRSSERRKLNGEELRV